MAATDTAASFQVWRNDRDTSELDRLTKVVDRLEAIAAERSRREQRVALEKRIGTQRHSNEALALRIREEGVPAIHTLLALVHDVAEAALIDADLNLKLSEGAERIVARTFLRDFARQQRARISRKKK